MENTNNITENELEAKDAAPEFIEVIGVSFRNNSKIYYFAPKGIQAELGQYVIVETSRGIEYGKVLIPNKMVSSTEIVSPLKSIIRLATEDDHERNEKNKLLEKDAMEICKQKIESHKLDMSLVGVEYTFDNSKLLFYFTSEGRVDFRELVKNLASIFKTRIELRQIGIRDEAKMMGGLGPCGRPFCCSDFLTDFAQVSIKMAKEQNFSLNSAKISGSCGRLMCCLRYEHEVYEQALKTTPPNGSTVSTPNGVGIVIETRPLLQMIKVRLEEKPETPKLFKCSEVKIIKTAKPQKNEDNDASLEDIEK
jgi:cell fate regulator YaaT (PSP1 superfamily)